MGLLSSLFGGGKPNEDQQAKQEKKNFEILKYDGIRARNMRQLPYAIKCFENNRLRCRKCVNIFSKCNVPLLRMNVSVRCWFITMSIRCKKYSYENRTGCTYAYRSKRSCF